jgi:hypothetical protein
MFFPSIADRDWFSGDVVDDEGNAVGIVQPLGCREFMKALGKTWQSRVDGQDTDIPLTSHVWRLDGVL